MKVEQYLEPKNIIKSLTLLKTCLQFNYFKQEKISQKNSLFGLHKHKKRRAILSELLF